MQTLSTEAADSSAGPIPRAKLNPSVYIFCLVVLAAAMTWASGSIIWAYVLPVSAVVLWVLAEALSVTVFLHRYLTHGAIGQMHPRLVRLFLWLTRSGMVKYWEWVEITLPTTYLSIPNMTAARPGTITS